MVHGKTPKPGCFRKTLGREFWVGHNLRGCVVSPSRQLKRRDQKGGGKKVQVGEWTSLAGEVIGWMGWGWGFQIRLGRQVEAKLWQVLNKNLSELDLSLMPKGNSPNLEQISVMIGSVLKAKPQNSETIQLKPFVSQMKCRETERLFFF